MLLKIEFSNIRLCFKSAPSLVQRVGHRVILDSDLRDSIVRAIFSGDSEGVVALVADVVAAAASDPRGWRLVVQRGDPSESESFTIAEPDAERSGKWVN